MKLKFFLPLLFLSFLFLLVWTCKKDYSHYNLPKISFVQIENDSTPNQLGSVIVLRASLMDIESASLKPEPEVVMEYGHIYSLSRMRLANILTELLDSTSLEELKQTQGIKVIESTQGLSIENTNNPDIQHYETTIPLDSIIDDTTYYYRAYVVRPDNNNLILSQSPPFSFEKKSVSVVTDKIVLRENIMNADVRAIITVGNPNITILSYRYILLDKNMHPIDTTISPISPINGQSSITYDIQLPYFEVDTTYYAQALIGYQVGTSDTIWTNEKIILNSNKIISNKHDFWVNTADVRKSSFTHMLPDELEHMLHFVMGNYAYIGKGKNSNGNYNNKFWRFDTRFYTWEEATGVEGEEGEGEVFFTLNGSAYFGLGKNQTNGDSTSFYTTDFSSGWVNIPILNSIESSLKGQNLMSIEEDVLKMLIARSDAFSYKKTVDSVYFGGGKGPVWQRDTVILPNTDCTEAGVTCNEKNWNDFNENGKIDGGDWVDLDGDGKIDILATNFTDTQNIPETLDIAGIAVTVILVTNSTENEFPDTLSINSTNPNPFSRSEWWDENHNDTIEINEVPFTNGIKDDLWKFDGTTFNYVGNRPAYKRSGATVFVVGGNVHLIGGINSTGLANNICMNNCTPYHGAPFSYGFSFMFTFDNSLYFHFGGGEEANGDLLPVNTQYYNNSMFKDALGCSLPRLSRGVAFGVNGKGFMGLGRTSNTPEITKELWMYIK